MLPLGHLSLAYLTYVSVAAIGQRQLPARWALLGVAFGSQFPDLVDKPLAYVGILSYGRSLAHSLFTFVLVVGVLWWSRRRLAGVWSASELPERIRQTVPAAFTVSYFSHLIGDAYEPLLAGRFSDAQFLLYPLYQLPPSPADEIAPWVRVANIYQQMETHPHIEVIILALIVFAGLRLRAYTSDRRPDQRQ